MYQNGRGIQELGTTPPNKIYSFEHLAKDVNERLKEFESDFSLLKLLVNAYRDIITDPSEDYQPKRMESLKFLEVYIENQEIEEQQLLLLDHMALEDYAQNFPNANLLKPYNKYKCKFKDIAKMIAAGGEFDSENEALISFSNYDTELLNRHWDDIKYRWKLQPSLCQEYLMEIFLYGYYFLVSKEHIYIDDFIYTLSTNKAHEQLIRYTNI